MIRIIIDSFRGMGATREDPRPKIFEFSPGLNLLKGESGRGKSTIINAFRWCLYREPGMGNSSLLKNALSKSPRVTIEFNVPGSTPFIVMRCGSPSLMEVTYLENGVRHTLTNNEAEAYIERLFGKEHYWRSTCFIQQGHHNPILDGLTVSEKREVFQTMTLNYASHILMDVSIDQLRDNILQLRKSLETEEKLREGKLKAMEEHHQTLLSGLSKPVFDEPYSETDVYQEGWNVPLVKLLTEYHLINVDAEPPALDELREKISDLELRLGERRRMTTENQCRKRDLENDMARHRTELSQHEATLNKALSLGDRYPDIIQTRKWLEANTMGEYLERAIGVYTFVKSCKRYYESLERHFPTGADRWSRVGGDFQRDADSIPEYTRTHHARLEMDGLRRSIAQVQARLEEVRKVLSNVHREEGSWLTAPYEDLQNELVRQLRQADGQTVVCPGCQKCLLIRPVGGTVVGYLYDRDETADLYRQTIQRRLDVIQVLLKDTRRQEELDRQLEELQGRLDGMRPLNPQYQIPFSHLNTMEMSSRSLLDQWVSFRKSVPLSVLDAVWNWMDGAFVADVRSVLDSLPYLLSPMRVGTVTDSIENMKGEISRLEALHMDYAQEKQWTTDLTRYRSMYSRESRRLELLAQLKTKFPGLDWQMALSDPDYVSRMMRLTEFRTALERYRQGVLSAEGHADRLRGERAELDAIRRKYNMLLDLNRHLDETEEEVIEHTISAVTGTVNELLDVMFEQNAPKLLVKSECKKTAKTSRDIQFLFTSSDGDETTRNIGSFSGGEADRLSLALTCAVSRFSDCPLLFLDECISSLDTELRDRVIRGLQGVVKDKVVIVVCHDTLDALFANIVPV